ncbi:hypothetical protein H4S07_004748 [Coemansia furcata]|uniref:Uncharacterized protein n=1 Tax=Coemansia furcata TaxID=417177 RepID=A0ACC1L6F5_9FUNG|nr:hypothetical protein H4S07_004748 [Coemansia furcata]
MFCRSIPRWSLSATRPGARWVSDLAATESINARLKLDLKEAMKAKEKNKLSVIKGVLSDILYAEKNATTGASFSRDSDTDVATLIQRAIKQRNESIQSYTAGGREDLAKAEEAEIGILAAYLPRQLTTEEIEAHVTQVIERLGVSGGAKAIGLVMREVDIGPAQAPKSKVAEVVKRLLSAK